MPNAAVDDATADDVAAVEEATSPTLKRSQAEREAGVETLGLARRDRQKDRRPAWHFRALTMFIGGADATAIARHTGYSTGTVKRLLEGEWMSAQCATFYDRFKDRAATHMLDPVIKFQAKLAEKIDLLDGLTRSEDEKISLAAIREWISHTIGTPVRRTEVDVKHSLTARSNEELRFIAAHGRMPTPQELAHTQQLALPAPTAERPHGDTHPAVDAEYSVEPEIVH